MLLLLGKFCERMKRKTDEVSPDPAKKLRVSHRPLEHLPEDITEWLEVSPGVVASTLATCAERLKGNLDPATQLDVWALGMNKKPFTHSVKGVEARCCNTEIAAPFAALGIEFSKPGFFAMHNTWFRTLVRFLRSVIVEKNIQFKLSGDSEYHLLQE